MRSSADARAKKNCDMSEETDYDPHDVPGFSDDRLELAYKIHAEQNACPRCEQPCPPESLIAGVCPKCKKNLAVRYASVLKNGKEKPEVSNEQDRNEKTYFDEESRKIRTTDDAESEEAFLQNICRDHAIDMDSAVDIVARCSNRYGGGLLTNDVVKKSSDLIQRLKAGHSGLIAYKGNQTMFARAIALRLEWYSVAGGLCPTQVARCCGVSKQTFDKCFDLANGLLHLKHLPPLPMLSWMRKEDSKNKMSTAQKKIWHNPKLKNSYEK